MSIAVFHLVCICLPLPAVNFPRQPGTKRRDWGGFCGCIARQRAGKSWNHEPQDTWVLLDFVGLPCFGFAVVYFFGWRRTWAISICIIFMSADQLIWRCTTNFEEPIWCWWTLTLAPRCEVSLKLVNLFELPSPEENVQTMPAKSQESAAL